MVVNTIRQERERIEAMRSQEDEIKKQETLRLLEKEKNRLESEVGRSIQAVVCCCELRTTTDSLLHYTTLHCCCIV